MQTIEDAHIHHPGPNSISIVSATQALGRPTNGWVNRATNATNIRSLNSSRVHHETQREGITQEEALQGIEVSPGRASEHLLALGRPSVLPAATTSDAEAGDVEENLRVSERSVERRRRAWREGGTAALASAGPPKLPS
ncbi:hypothetical protein [Streptomyces sp. IMTB 2501]|uniref:hypothetical protein n=1 Tax=Streptomyces sp. IMTB 2501 TaxID=1776340 RepID=UPI0021172BA9|nr:hypothetical protein [Streptomyces sp. IMTB 2501]